MNIKEIKIGATIPVGQYANIQPQITLESENLKEGIDYGMSQIKNLFARYSEKGELIEKDVLVQEKIQSFNEDVVIEYEPITHSYTVNGVRLRSVTDYVKDFYSEFDAIAVARNLEKPWEVSSQEILDLWADNNNISTSFGNLVHKMLENYFKNKSLGEKISEKRGETDNYILPKHPILKTILTEFISVYSFDEGCEYMTEVVLSDVESKLCGRTDLIKILDKEKKICRIQDFKVNIESEKIDSKLKPAKPFNELPANKISKYQIQLSIYANMLQKQGWTVEGLDVFVLEEGWKDYKLEVLKVI